jgi:hypothetical protein
VKRTRADAHVAVAANRVGDARRQALDDSLTTLIVHRNKIPGRCRRNSGRMSRQAVLRRFESV